MHRILELWGNSFFSTFVALPTLASLYYWAIAIGSLILRPMYAVGVVDLAKALDFTGLGSFVLHCMPARTYCHSLLEHPFALAVTSALLAYYLAVGVVWADKVSPTLSEGSLHTQSGEFALHISSLHSV